jgi:hypothetical protein
MLSQTHSMLATLIVLGVALLGTLPAGPDALQARAATQAPAAAAPQRIDLAQRRAEGKLRAVNREVTSVAGTSGGIHVTEKEAPGVVWIEGTEFSEGTLEIEVRGRDVVGQSFLGLAFHRKNDDTYESVYLRPFNFRAQDPARHQHAVQYMAPPDYDWPRLRAEFPEEFENPVDQSVVPTDWVPLRVVVKGARIQVYVGRAAAPALEARKLGALDRGTIGLWVGNNSDGDFANLRITPSK